MYVTSLPVFAYASGIYRTCSDDAGWGSMITRTEDLLMTMECFFAAYRDSRSSHLFGLAQFDGRRGGFSVPLLTGIFADFGHCWPT